MLTLKLETQPGLASVADAAGLEPLDDAQLEGTAGGGMFIAALYVAAGLGGAVALGVIIGAGIYIYTH